MRKSSTNAIGAVVAVPYVHRSPRSSCSCTIEVLSRHGRRQGARGTVHAWLIGLALDHVPSPLYRRSSVKNFASTIATIWRLSVPYFRSEDRWPGRILLAAVIAIELSLVALQVILNQWYNRFYNTLQDRDWNAFVSAILFFCVLAAIYTVLAVYQTYLNQWLQIRWRRWMTQTYLRQWLTCRQSLSHAASRRRRRQSGPAHRRRLADVRRLHADDRHRRAEFDRQLLFVRRHSVGRFPTQAPLHLFGAHSQSPAIWSGPR